MLELVLFAIFAPYPEDDDDLFSTLAALQISMLLFYVRPSVFRLLCPSASLSLPPRVAVHCGGGRWLAVAWRRRATKYT